MKVFWALLICFGVIAIVGVGIFIAIFGRMIFIDKFAEASVGRMKNVRVLDAAYTVVELEQALPPLTYEYKPGAGDVVAAREILLTAAGELQEGQRVFDSDTNRTVLLLESREGQPDKVFSRNEIYGTDAQRLGPHLHSFAEPGLQVLRYVGGLNSDWFLLTGDPESSQYSDSKLWQVSHSDYSRHLLAEDPYFTFARPPRTFLPEGFSGTVLVYYTGSVHFGFGGDSSRPKYSVVRLFTEDYPTGHDIARFAFRAGTIVDVRFEDGFLVFYGDPSRPGSEKRLPPRVWKLEKREAR